MHTIQKLRRLTNFDALVDYLRDELDWPIEVEDAEDLVFEYDPASLFCIVKLSLTARAIRPCWPTQPAHEWPTSPNYGWSITGGI
ncbi:MAG: hypothetical protein ACP5J4_15575 [Anaerolineae bacterium]